MSDRLVKSSLWTALPVVALLLLGVAAPVGTAHAQLCETPADENSDFNDLASDIRQDFTDFMTQEENYITELITHRAKYEMINRLYEFDYNIRVGLTNWWWNSSGNCFLCAMKHMTMQLSADQVDQTRMLGSIIDAQLQNEVTSQQKEAEVEAQRRYTPNENSCTIDSVATNDACPYAEGCSVPKVQKLSRALTRAMTKTAEIDLAASVGTPAAKGTASQQAALWDDYVAKWCDPAVGDQGCPAAAPGPTRHQHTNIPGLLWGDKQTLDMSNADTRDIVNTAQRYFIQLKADNPIQGEAIDSPQGQETLLDRRSNRARINTIRNVVGQLIAERAPGSGINTRDIRMAAGLPVGDAATDASYREIQQAMSMDRHRDPAWIVRMVNEPEAVVKEQGSINAIKMQQMNDIYKRWEEVMFMQAAQYASMLDQDVPVDTDNASPKR